MEEGCSFRNHFQKSGQVLSYSLHLALSLCDLRYIQLGEVYFCPHVPDRLPSRTRCSRANSPRSFFLPPSLYASLTPLSISLYFSASNLLHLSLIQAFCLLLFIFYQSLSLSVCVCRVPVVRCPAFCREGRKHEENINKTRLMSQSRREKERQAKREEEIVRKGCLVSLWSFFQIYLINQKQEETARPQVTGEICISIK